MPANPDGPATDPPGSRYLGHALRDMGDVARFDGESPMRFFEDGGVRLVTPRLSGSQNQIELPPECRAVAVNRSSSMFEMMASR